MVGSCLFFLFSVFCSCWISTNVGIGITNGLRELVSLNVDNCQDAVHELYNFCVREEHCVDIPLFAYIVK